MANGTVVASNGQTIVPTITLTAIPNSQSSAGASSSNHSTPVGAIVGGTAGALVAILGIGVLLCLMRRRRQRAGTTYNLDLVDNEPKPYTLHTGVSFNGQPHQETQVLVQPLPVAPPAGVCNAPSSKFRPASVSYRVAQSASSDGLISPQERSESSRTRPHAHTTSSTTFLSTSRSVPEPSQPASLSSPSRRSTSLSRRDTTMTRSSVSQSRAGRSRGQPVHEEDAGLLVDLAGASDSWTLPPAYNPTWGQRQ